MIDQEMKETICDIHCHILPGIDDGSRNWDMTLQMVQQSWDAGVRTMIATPHYLPWHERLKGETVLSLVEEARQKVASELGVEMIILAGEELYYHSGLIEELQQGKALTMAGSRYILLEFAEDASYSEIRMAVQRFQRSPWKPIIAHVERYGALRKKQHLDEILSMGAQLQSNAEEMQRRIFDSTRRWLRKCYDARFISYIGSDAHDVTERPPLSEASLKWFRDSIDNEYRAQLFGGGPFVKN